MSEAESEAMARKAGGRRKPAPSASKARLQRPERLDPEKIRAFAKAYFREAFDLASKKHS